MGRWLLATALLLGCASHPPPPAKASPASPEDEKWDRILQDVAGRSRRVNPQLDPDSLRWYLKAVRHKARGEIAEARFAVARSLELDPRNSEARKLKDDLER